MSWEDEFIHRLPLEKLTRTSNGFKSRCPVCGDSKRNQRKTRFYVYIGKNGNYLCECFKCDLYPYGKIPLGKFLKEFYPELHADYQSEYFKNCLGMSEFNQSLIEYEQSQQTISLDEFKQNQIQSVIYKFQSIREIATYQQSHPVLWVLKNRMIPEFWFDHLRFADSFKNVCEEFIKIDSSIVDFDYHKFDFPAILIPIYDRYGKLIYVQGRNLHSNAALRYATVKIDPNHPKVWGLNRIDRSKTVFVFEGVFDAMFINNSLAMLGSSAMCDFIIKDVGHSDLIFVLDNELSAKEINQAAQKISESGAKVLIWDGSIPFKDLNDMVINKVFMSSNEIVEYIIENSFDKIMLETRLKLLGG